MSNEISVQFTVTASLPPGQGFGIDLSCKQLTVDFVNQSVLQISSQDVEGKRSDKTDFAERLGTMNRRWQTLQGLITEKVSQVVDILLQQNTNKQHQLTSGCYI